MNLDIFHLLWLIFKLLNLALGSCLV
jgi:hypothetical protein